MVTPLAFVGWLCDDYEDKIGLSMLPQITAASGGQWWPSSCHDYYSIDQFIGLELHWSKEDKPS
jgi:hypothetical protein